MRGKGGDSMNFVELRNALIYQIYLYMNIPIVLSSQVDPKVDVPYICYDVITPYLPANTLGDHLIANNGGIVENRKEHCICTMSFTACSANRECDNEYIYGEDEALLIAEKLESWFLLVGHDKIRDLGIAIVDVTNVQPRSMLMIDEMERRYGLDVAIRYVRTDSRKIGKIEKVNIDRGTL